MSLSRTSTSTSINMPTRTSNNINTNTKRQRRAWAALRKAKTARDRAASAVNSTVEYAESGSDSDRDSASDMSDVPTAVVLTDAMRKEIVDNGRHFSKIATRFAFNDNTPSYSSFVIQFKAELESYGLEHTLTEQRQTDSPLSVLSQKTVYNMIIHCVPKSVLPSITVTLAEHSAYEAWRVLRRQYIGDEATYLQGLETRFNRVIWLDGEEFNMFEVRFGQIVSELESAGQLKPDHVKKSVFMHAIESSNKKDVRGLHVFDRLNTTSKIHFEKAFQEWMVHLRVEAQQIHDAIANEVENRRGSKRAHADHVDSSREESVPISLLTPANAPSSSSAMPSYRPPGPAPFHSQRRDRNPSVCFSMARTGSCKYGAQCRYSHDSVPVRQVQQFGRGPSSSSPFQTRPVLCNLFQAGRCNWGDKCRFAHSRPNGGVPQGGAGPSTDRHQFRRVDYGEEKFPHSGAPSPSHG